MPATGFDGRRLTNSYTIKRNRNTRSWLVSSRAWNGEIWAQFPYKGKVLPSIICSESLMALKKSILIWSCHIFIVHSLAFHPEPAGNEEFSRLHIIRHRYGQTLNMDVMPLKSVEPIALPAGIGKIYRIIIIPDHRPVVFFSQSEVIISPALEFIICY